MLAANARAEVLKEFIPGKPGDQRRKSGDGDDCKREAENVHAGIP